MIPSLLSEKRKEHKRLSRHQLQRKTSLVPEEVAEYKDWNLREFDISFTNARLFNQVKSTFSMMLLGQSGVLFTISLHSSQMDLKIRDSEIKDINATIDVLSKLAGQFGEGLERLDLNEIYQTGKDRPGSCRIYQ